MLDRRSSPPHFVRLLLVPALGMACLLLSPSHGRARDPGDRVEVPIAQHQLSDGTIRYSVPVSVGGSGPIEAMLDTGSFGLRVMADALPPASYEPTDVERPYRFTSGVELRGVLARAPVTVGAATTGKPVIIQVVRSVGCLAGRPRCPASRVAPADYRIGGNGLPGEGFKAIVGISIRRPATELGAFNPLSSMGSGSWLITLPLPGAAGPGTLVINPDANDLAGFRFVPMFQEDAGQDGMAQLNDTVIAVCPEDTQDGSCVRMKVDSGARDGLRPFYLYALFIDQRRGVFGFKPRETAAR